jgi:uncharacterized protein YfcZ (UPF0381/DUF406 family)
MVEDYFVVLTRKETSAQKDACEITPLVANLKAGVTLPADYDYKADKADYLLNVKHK